MLSRLSHEKSRRVSSQQRRPPCALLLSHPRIHRQQHTVKCSPPRTPKPYIPPSKMDRQTVYSLDLWGEQKSEVSEGQESNRQVQKKLVDFILSFAVDNAFIYRYIWISLVFFGLG